MSEPTIIDVNPAAESKEPLVDPASEPKEPLNEPIEVPGQREAYASAVAKLADQEETTAYQGVFHAYLRCVSALCHLQ